MSDEQHPSNLHVVLASYYEIFGSKTEKGREIHEKACAEFGTLLAHSSQRDEAFDVAQRAIDLGKQQADEWDRFWEALGVKSADITVDQAIGKYKAIIQERDKLRSLVKRCVEPMKFVVECSEDLTDSDLLEEIEDFFREGTA
jgi:hypothetical protein